MEQPRKCSHAGFWIMLILLAIFLGFSVLVNFGLIVSMALTNTPKPSFAQRGGEDEFPKLRERWSCGKGRVKAVRIALEGAIFRERGDGFFPARYDKVEAILRQVRAAQADDAVRAIILEVDSPGGAITPSDEIYRALLQFKKSDARRKVVVFIRDLAASGGYYIAMAGDHLVAEPTAVVGSIGVIMSSLNWKALSEKIGLTDVTIKSGANKDLLNPFHDVPPEQRALLQALIDNMYGQFLKIVSDGRKLEVAVVKPLADGRVFPADEAKNLKLVDELGYWDQAVTATKKLLGERTLRVVRYEEPAEFGLFNLFAEARAPKLINPVALERPQLMYLWKP
ncbi:MAG: signal peptide peptidase SppA [Kiritimatiellaeota bacterium]|nr:signal peptide peptidase SppA [Kiritimatiellota bacterium]